MSDGPKRVDQMSVVSSMLEESRTYGRLDDLESYIQAGGDFSMLPTLPIYMSMRDLSTEVVAPYLPKLSPRQRQSLLDLDCWYKDELEPQRSEKWLMAFYLAQDEKVIKQFVLSENFKLFLKGRFHLHTFDAEDPQYPDHDYYFLTDDNLLLIEYDEDFSSPQELRVLLRHFYAELGVEKAYDSLLKLITEPYSSFQEECYQFKKERLRDIGYVDYYEALDLISLKSDNQVKSFIEKKNKSKPDHIDGLDLFMQNQAMHASIVKLVTVEKFFDIEKYICEASSKRQQILAFSLMRLLTSLMTLKNSWHSSELHIAQMSLEAISTVKLALDYLLKKSCENVFHYFDFVDLYKVGHGLKSIRTRALLKEQEKWLQNNLGNFWGATISNGFESIESDGQSFSWLGQSVTVEKVESLEVMDSFSKLLHSIYPLVRELRKQMDHIINEKLLSDQYYLNYQLDEIDFEALILTLLARKSLKQGESESLGISLDDFQAFRATFMKVKSNDSFEMIVDDDKAKDLITNFIDNYGLVDVKGIDNYLLYVLKSHLDDVEYENLNTEDFAHIGGPILIKG